MQKKYKAIMVSKTHWDREHSRPFEQFRWHLVYNVMDKLMEIYENVPEYKSFMFDGQSLGIWDYLEIRPEREPDIARYVKEGRLVVGPFFVGPDEFIPSGESLIRNLLMGHKIANQFGGVMKIGYNPDAFGHIAQLPQILRGFGIDAAVFSRGVGEDVGKPGTEFLWEAPDGSEIIAVYNHYGNTAGLSTDLESALNQIKNAIKSLQPKELPYFLLSNGSDGSPPQAHIPEVIRYANEKLALERSEGLEDMEIVHGTLQQYIDLVRSSASRLPRYSGELRWGRYNLILGGVYSARTYLKQANAQTQTLLEKYAEPFAAFAWAMVGDEYPAAFFSRAWYLLLQNHFHDTICACSQDAVYHDAMMRYAHSQQIAEKLKERSLKVLVREIQTQSEIPNATALVVFNPLSFERTEVATKKIYLPVEAEGQLTPYVVKDAEGKVIPSQIRHQRIREHFQPTFWDKRYPTGKRIREFDISFIAESVPPCGYKTYYLCSGEKNVQIEDLSVTKMGMENDFLLVSINPNGTLNLTDKCSGQSYSDLHFFEDVESVCGEYNHYTSPNSQVITSLNEPARITLFESGPICATVKIELEMLLPEAATEDVQGRSEKLVSCPITTYVTLSARSRRLDFRTIVDNQAKDHRLRVRFPTGIRTDSVHAEGQFHVIQRNIQLPDATGWAEPPVPEHPHQTFVSLTDGQRGFTLINKGLPEYTAEKTEEGVTLSLTLLRSVGWIGREFFVTAAYKIPTPDAQCLGKQEFEYALVLHEGGWKDAKVWQMAHGFNAPFEIAESSLHAGSLLREASVALLQPDELIITAIKKSENDDALVIRLYNISDKPTTGRLTLFSPLQKAMVTNLLEEPLEEIPISNDGKNLVFPVKGHQIVTLKIWFADTV